MSLRAFVQFLQQNEPWMRKAACADKNPDLFFPKRGDSTKTAKKTCAGCPVKTDCTDYAHRTHTEHGIWGGEIIST